MYPIFKAKEVSEFKKEKKLLMPNCKIKQEIVIALDSRGDYLKVLFIILI